MIDPLVHARRLLDQFRREIADAPTDDFVREVSLGAWGALTGGTYEPPPDPGPGGTLIAHWSFAGGGSQTDLTGNGHTMVQVPDGSWISDLTGQVSAFSVTFTTHAGFVPVPGLPGVARTSVSVAPAVLGGTYGPDAPDSGTIRWAITFNPYLDIGERVKLYRNAVLIDAPNMFETLAGSYIRVYGAPGYISSVKVWNSYQTPETLAAIT